MLIRLISISNSHISSFIVFFLHSTIKNCHYDFQLCYVVPNSFSAISNGKLKITSHSTNAHYTFFQPHFVVDIPKAQRFKYKKIHIYIYVYITQLMYI